MGNTACGRLLITPRAICAHFSHDLPERGAAKTQARLVCSDLLCSDKEFRPVSSVHRMFLISYDFSRKNRLSPGILVVV